MHCDILMLPCHEILISVQKLSYNFLFYLTVHIIKADKTKNNVYTIKGQFQQLKFFNENDIYIFLLNTFADQC